MPHSSKYNDGKGEQNLLTQRPNLSKNAFLYVLEAFLVNLEMHLKYLSVQIFKGNLSRFESSRVIF